MDINRANLDSLYTGFTTKLQEGFGMAPRPFERFGMTVASSTSMETYGWLMLLSRMRKWAGDRIVQNVESELMTLVNEDYEHTVGVSRNDIEDDKLGIYGPLFQQLGADAAALWDRLALLALVGNGLWLDGAAFFGTTRKYGGNTISNYATGALTETTFNTAYQTMMEYVGANDEALGVVPDLLVVGPKNRTVAHGIVNQGPGASSANPNAGVVDVLVHPRLVGTYDDYWFLLETKGPVKPVAVQKRKEGALVRWDRDTDECVKVHNRNDYGVHYRGVAGLTLPHKAYGVIL